MNVREDHLGCYRQSRRVWMASQLIDEEMARIAAGPASKATTSADTELARLHYERDSLRQLLFEAAQMQRRVSALRQVNCGPLDIAGEIFPVRHVSGDFLTSCQSGSRTVLAIGDIMGKSLAAGMWFTHMVGLIRIFADALMDPRAMAAAINDHLSALRPEAPMTTLFIMQVESGTGELTYCNAGHPAPLLLCSDGSIKWLGKGGPLIGAFARVRFDTGFERLTPGDVLVGYSDGLLECSNPQGEEFGEDRLVECTRSAAARPASLALFSVLAAAQDFAAGQPQVDDVALMIVRHGGKE